jgi:hypothetical protein
VTTTADQFAAVAGPRPKWADYQADDVTFRRNRDQTRLRHVDECFLCGRGLTQSGVDNAWWVHLCTDGTLLTQDDTEHDSQGCFPVGSECAKRIARPWKFKIRTEW